MKKNSFAVKTALLSALVLSAAPVIAERGPDYISPNNDGVKDALEVPLKIKEKRYITAWSFIITNQAGEVVRTIKNKERFDEKLTFVTFFKRLFSTKQNVEVPSTVVWNGFLDDGSLAKDGTYYYYFTATDDSGNVGQTGKHIVVIDNTAPVINLTQLAQNQKNFGEGSKSTLKLEQTGSKEELWTATIKDVDGKTVHNYKWEKSAPLTLEWDGTDDSGAMVADGVYSYEISATDLAGNVSEKAQISNIIFSAEKPETSVAIDGSRYFAPEGKTSAIKTINLNVSVPLPVSKANGLSEWKVEVIGNKDNKVYRTYSGTNNPPSSNIIFDGNDDKGVALKEGEYRAKVTAKYLNGYEPPATYSSAFVLDNTPPKANARPSTDVFNGTDKKLSITQSEVPAGDAQTERAWTGKIVYKADETVVKKYDFGSNLSDSIEWDGKDETGFPAKDGEYIYVLEGVDLAGNTASYPSSTFKLDSIPTELYISVSPQAFSTKGNSAVKSVTISSRAKAASGLKSYTFKIFSKDKKEVWSTTGSNTIPASLKWNGIAADGTVCADGSYYVELNTVAVSGTTADAKSSDFIIDSENPTVDLSADYTIFSPDGTGSRQSLPVKVTNASKEEKWVCEVKNAAGKVVYSKQWSNTKPSDFAWNGTDNNGNKAANGTYSITVSSTDRAGNSVSKTLSNITLDARPVTAYVTNELPGFSPNGDGILESQKFTIHTSVKEGISAWKFTVVDEKGKSVKTFSNADRADLPETITWGGDTDDKTVADGTFTGKLHVEYAKGNVADASTAAFICTAVAPVLTVRTSPKYFSPDNDGNDDDLFIQLKGETKANLKNWSFTIYDRNGAPFWKTSGKSSITERIIWDGRGNNGELVTSAEDYPCVFEATDDLGMKSRVEKVINVDVLVVRDGDKLKMQVPSIIFRSDAADFLLKGEKDSSGKTTVNGITAEQKANNERVIKRISEILKKFGDYKVTIVGHSNRTTTDSREETEDNPQWGKALTPLSKERAQYVKSLLVKYGISSSRLSVDGKGGTEPVADTKDKAVNWKNRRVEFILEK